MKNLAFPIARGKFAIDIQTGLAMFPRVHAFLVGEDVDFTSEETNNRIQAGIVTADWTRALDEFVSGDSVVEPGSLGVISVVDTVMKDDWCGWSGTMTMASQLKWMDANENISGIILDIDSPGGQVDGTATFADAIKNSSTPVVAVINDGMACSAAYWIASAADQVYATHRHSEVGSIGVYARLSDFSEYYKEKGIKLEDVYSNHSDEKNLGYREWLKGNADEFKKRLDSTAEEFISVVKENRNGKLDLSVADPFKGNVYRADKAVEIGLIDGIKSFDEVVSGLLKEETLTLQFS